MIGCPHFILWFCKLVSSPKDGTRQGAYLWLMICITSVFFKQNSVFGHWTSTDKEFSLANLIDVPLGSFTLFEFSRVSIVTILKVSTCSKTTKFFCQDFALPYKNASKNAIVWFPSCEIPSTDIALACDRTQRSFIFRLSSELLISLILVFMSYSELS